MRFPGVANLFTCHHAVLDPIPPNLFRHFAPTDWIAMPTARLMLLPGKGLSISSSETRTGRG